MRIRIRNTDSKTILADLLIFKTDRIAATVFFSYSPIKGPFKSQHAILSIQQIIVCESQLWARSLFESRLFGVNHTEFWDRPGNERH